MRRTKYPHVGPEAQRLQNISKAMSDFVHIDGPGVAPHEGVIGWRPPPQGRLISTNTEAHPN